MIANIIIIVLLNYYLFNFLLGNNCSIFIELCIPILIH